MSTEMFQSVLFKEIKSKLPQDSWAAQVNKINNDEFLEEIVFYHKGDLQLQSLDLDHLANEHEDQIIFLILVEGSLTVDTFICNENTDGSTGLIVLGDLKTTSMVVGGQEIFVTGDVEVSELFWGDYNHGMLNVQGHLKAALCLQTDEYSIQAKTKEVAILINDAHELIGAEIIAQECLIEEDEEVIIDREELMKLLYNGKQVVTESLLEDLKNGGATIPFVFPNAEINIANLERLSLPSFMNVEPVDGLYEYEYWQEDICTRVLLEVDQESNSNYKAVYLEKEGQYAVFLEARREETNSTAWEPLMITCRNIAGEDTQWYYFDAGSPEHFHLLLKYGWGALLKGVSQYEYAKNLINPSELRELLKLPLVQPYDDYYDDEKNGFWLGQLYYAFREKGVDEDGNEEPELIKVAYSYIGEDGEEKLESFFYYISKKLDRSEVVEIEYRADEDDEQFSILSYIHPALLKQAIRLFHAAKRTLTRQNQVLMNGYPPYDADKFALKYWRKQGYLSK
ncbi:hypothetical protein [Bacillus horti]|uniref:Uncharacterized protein n=1 Tax=Caldalkalibacillus horti TaxID=77523 RepID=A0ABT9VXL5_9BACI|nr:hypothetical protein [Bacillus horti]MDQ0165360.1 hypothetical protein [Bacillus horti]